MLRQQVPQDRIRAGILPAGYILEYFVLYLYQKKYFLAPKNIS